MRAGWQPRNTWWPHQIGLQIEYGNGYEFWRRGHREIKAASPTGYAFCRFEFVDVYSNVLVVVTAGEEIPEYGCQAGVVNVFLDTDNEGNNGRKRSLTRVIGSEEPSLKSRFSPHKSAWQLESHDLPLR